MRFKADEWTDEFEAGKVISFEGGSELTDITPYKPYKLFEQDNSVGDRCLWFIDDVGDERCAANLDEYCVIGTATRSAYYLNHDFGEVPDSTYLMDVRTLLATIRKHNFNGDQIRAYLQGLIDSKGEEK